MRCCGSIKGGVETAFKGFVLVSDMVCQQTRAQCMTTGRVRSRVRCDDLQVRYVFQ